MDSKMRKKGILDKFIDIFSDFKGKIVSFSEKSKRNYFLVYFLAFALLFSIISFIFYFCIYFCNGKTVIWAPDGKDQYMISLKYFGNWGKSIIDAFFSNGTLQVPFWDSKIAMGSDVLITLNYYIVGDPIGLLAIIWPKDHYVTLYTLGSILRIFLAGVSFSVMCFYFKKGRFQTILGSLIYTFSGYVLVYSMRHPIFTIPLYLLPLLIIGAEMIFRKKSPVLFIVIIALSAVNNFYFFYYLTIMIVAYAIARYIFHYRKVLKEKLILLMLRFSIFYLIGVGLAAFLFLPTIFSFLGNGRIGANGYLPMFFPIKDYIEYIPNLVVGYKYTPLLFPCLVLLFMQKEPKYRMFKIAVIVFQVMMLLPVFGYMFNGFNYFNDRWNFLIALTYSFICVCMMPKLKSITKNQVMIVFVSFLVGLAITILFAVNTKELYFLFSVQIIILCIFLFISAYGDKVKDSFFKTMIAIIVIFAIVMQGQFWYSPAEQNHIERFIDKEELVRYENEELLDDVAPFYRIDTTLRDTYNDGMIHGFNSVSGYFSTFSGVYFDFFEQTLSGSKDVTPSRFNGFDRRASLNTLASVKYLEREASIKTPIPYGYGHHRTINKNGKDYMIYRNKNSLPLGYTYSNVIYKDEFEMLTPEQKQEAMIGSIYLEEPIQGYSSTPFNEEYIIDYEIEGNENATIKGDKIDIRKANAEIKLKFDSSANSETYIRLTNLVDNLKPPIDDLEYYLLSDDPESHRNFFKKFNRFSQAPLYVDITVSTENIKNVKTLSNSKADLYSGIHNFMFNLGFSKGRLTEATLSFNKIGVYSLEDLAVVCVPMKGFAAKVDKLRENILENVRMDTNMISGNISLKEDKILCLSIPYLDGFTAYVNGQETEILKANIMYSAIPLKAGENKVVIRYKTPYLKEGVIISAGSFILLLGILIFRGIKRKRKKI